MKKRAQGTRTPVKPIAEEKQEDQPTRKYVQAPVVIDPGVPCPHCGNRYENKTTHTYLPHGSRRMKCAKCGLPFPAKRLES